MAKREPVVHRATVIRLHLPSAADKKPATIWVRKKPDVAIDAAAPTEQPNEASKKKAKKKAKKALNLDVPSPDVWGAIVRTLVIKNVATAHYARGLQKMLDGVCKLCGESCWTIKGSTCQGDPAAKAAQDIVMEIVGLHDPEADEKKKKERSKKKDKKAKAKAKVEVEDEPDEDKPDLSGPGNRSRGYGDIFTNPASTSCGKSILMGGPTAQKQHIDFLNRLAADPAVIKDFKIKQALIPTGRPPGWMVKDETSSSGYSPHPDWKKWRKGFERWIEEQRQKGTDDSPVGVLFHADEFRDGGRFMMKPLYVLAGTGPEAITAELQKASFADAASALASSDWHRVKRAQERKARDQKIATDFKPLFGESWWKKLDEYESKRSVTSGGEYHVGMGGDLRGWGKVRKAWLERRWEGTEPTSEELRKVRTKLHAKNPENQGDATLCNWLAEKDQWHLWDGSGTASPGEREHWSFNHVSVRAGYNRLARSLDGVAFSYADPINHPIGVAYSIGGGSNNLNLRDVSFSAPTGLAMSLLFRENDKVVEKDIVLPMAPNRRLSIGNDKALRFDDKVAAFRDAKLRLKRSVLKRVAWHMDEKVRGLLGTAGAENPAAIEAIVCEIVHHYRDKDGRRPVYMHASFTLKKLRRLIDDVMPLKDNAVTWAKKEEGLPFMPRHLNPSSLPPAAAGHLRILGVNLGMRVGAGVAVASVVPSSDLVRYKLDVPVFKACEGVYIVLEHQSCIRLKDEDSSNQRIQTVNGLMDFGLRMINRQNEAARVLRLQKTDPKKAATEIVELSDIMDLRDQAMGPAMKSTNQRLREAVNKALDLTITAGEKPSLDLLELLRAYDALNIVIRGLDKWHFAFPGSVGDDDNRTKSDIPMGGPSIARINALENRMRYERAYSTRSRPPEKDTGTPEARRLTRGEGFMYTLREKLLRLKKDRCAKLAFEIVQAAIAEGCHIIVMEDMLAYKFSYGRPKSENKRLAAWCHREILKRVCMNAELAGLIVGLAPAGYISQYSAPTGAPGCRVTRHGDRLEISEDGMEFLPCRGDLAHADTNAAQNVALRFMLGLTPVYLRLALIDKKAGTYACVNAGDYKNMVFERSSETVFVPTNTVLENVPQVKEFVRVFRDLSKDIEGGAWVEADVFWAQVRQIVEKRVEVKMPKAA